MFKRLILPAAVAVLPFCAALAADPAPSDAGAGQATWAFLRSPLPGAPASCPDAAPAGSGLVKVPLFAEKSGACPVATIEGQAITLEELTAVLVASHEGRGEAVKAGKVDALTLLNRLVDVELVVMDARAMGIDELPEVQKGLKAIEERVAREIVKRQVLQGVPADPALVDRLYKEQVREWKLQSVLFVRESDAKAMAAQVKAGKSFDALASKAVADKTAKGNEPGQFVHGSQLIAPVLANVEKTKVGKITPPIKVPGGWAVVEVEEIRYPEDPKARAEAYQKALPEAHKKVLKTYYDGLLKRYAKFDDKLVKKLDFEAKKPGFEALLKDQRVLVRVEGQKPITVADLAQALQARFYHGPAGAAQVKKLNKAKYDALDALVSPLVVADEVERLGIRKTDQFRKEVESDTRMYLFETFVQKAVLPGVKVDEAAVRKYYESHKADYTSAAFYKVETVGFSTQKAAEAAVAKLRGGTDFKWLNANADGKLAEGKDTERPPTVISAKAMTPAFAKAVEGAKAGDFRVYAAPHDQYYAVHVVGVTPPAAQPFEEVSAAITEKLYGEALQKAAQDWIEKLRKAHPVQIYLTRIGG